MKNKSLSKIVVKNFFLLVCLLVGVMQVHAQQLAFPTAEGAGAFTSGGRGTPSSLTTVFEVTSLSDDGSAGTLRYAVNQSTTTYPYRTIVFRISGTIHLTSALKFPRNTTVAGQTAPGDGICLADYPVSVNGDNVIIRYMRFRMGDKNQNKGMVDGSGNDDAFDGTGVNNVIIDHCTCSWSNDEACTFYRGNNITLQWNIISEPLNYSYHFETGDADFEHHGYGGIWGGQTASFHHNLLAHCQGRVPRFDGSRNLPNSSSPVIGSENADFRNNVLYNWGAYNTNGGEGGNYNIINNYYKYGPSTSTSISSGVTVRYEILNPYKQTSPALPYGKYYVTGNYIDGSAATTANNWKGAAMSGGSYADTTSAKATTAFSLPAVNTQLATDAYTSVLQNAGCSLPTRDTLDVRIMNDVVNRTGRIIDVQGGYPHGTPYANTVNAWPALSSGNPSTDTDHDGMPDWWETLNSLNINSATDRGTVASDGYTMIEKYLNAIPAWNAHAAFTAISGAKVNSVTGRISFTTNWAKDGFKYGLFKSSDSVNYTKINEISSNVNAINFTVDDASLPTGKTFYRIGSYKVGVTPDTLYSTIVSINNPVVTAVNTVTGANDALSVFPNPAKNSITITHAAANNNASISLFDMDGRRIAIYKLPTGSLQTNADVAFLPNGNYVVMFNNGNDKKTVGFAKQ
jgi:hypothetical protein